MIRTAVLLALGMSCLAWAEEAPQAAAPKGMTKNMVWLPKATLLRHESKGTATFTDGKREYVVTFIPDNMAVDETTPAIIVRGPAIPQQFGGRRLYRWFSAGAITKGMIEDWDADSDAASAYPLR